MARIGTRRKLVEVRQAAPGGDAYGDAGDRNYTTVETVHASVVPLRGRELMDAQQVEAEVTHLVRFRYMNTLAELDGSWQLRLKRSGREFDVLTAINVRERNRDFEVMAKERRPNG